MKKTVFSLICLFLFASLLHADFDQPALRVCLVSGSAEYDSDTSLSMLKDYLESHYNVQCVLLKAQGFEKLPGLEALEDCDTALFFTRRLRIDGEALQRVKNYCLSGKPVVAVRTASHGFQNWLVMDQLILGGNYHGHFGNGPTQAAQVVKQQASHPVLEGIGTLYSRYSLYRTGPVADDVTVLMTATTPEHSEPQPSAWIREVNGGRVFYTALGGVQDFQNASFRHLLANALYWTANRKVQIREQKEIPRRAKPEGTLCLKLRTRTQPFKGCDEWEEVVFERDVPLSKIALIICDMWDQHWCKGATERCEALAQKINPVVQAARDSGIQIIHAPSDTLEFYADWPQRHRVQWAPQVPLPTPLDLPTHPLPIDDSDGGCDTAEKPWYHAWTRQSPLIDIGPYDGISDNGKEVFNFLEQEGIQTLLYTGVHTNMCVLGRSFAIRPMTRWGKQCVLIRDLTDTMYDPKDAPYVSHDEGTRLVVEHIEKYWCPTTTSEELITSLSHIK